MSKTFFLYTSPMKKDFSNTFFSMTVLVSGRILNLQDSVAAKNLYLRFFIEWWLLINYENFLTSVLNVFNLIMYIISCNFFIFWQNLAYDSSKFLALGAENDYCIKFDFWGQQKCMHTNVPKEQTRLNEFLAVTFLFSDEI